MADLPEDGDGISTAHGSIDRIEVENFKSYRGHQAIGPFKNFTAIIGPNGSGKSNLMDAISFVLGVRTAQLRGNLKELLYSNSEGKSAADRPRNGYVKLVFRTADEEEVAFARVIQPASQDPEAAHVSVYKVADKTVTWEAYCARLSAFGILVKVRNFLVFQGDIEAMASRTPKQLTTLFEQISGSDVFKVDYDRLEQERADAEEQAALLFAKKKAINAEKRQKKEQKEEAERHISMMDELHQIKSQHLLWQLYHVEVDIKNARQEKRKHELKLQQVASENLAKDKEVAVARAKLAGAGKERLSLENKLKRLVKSKDQKSPKLIKLKEEASRLTKRLNTAENEVEAERARVAAQKDSIKKLEKELRQVAAAEAKLQADAERYYAKHDASGQLSVPEVQAEYHKLKEEAAAKTAALSNERSVLQQQQEADQESLRRVQGATQQLRERAAALREQIEVESARRAKLEEQLAATRSELAEKAAARGKLDEERRKTSNQQQQLERDIARVNDELAVCKQNRRESERDKKVSEAIMALKRLFPGVHGRFTELGKAHQRRHHLALSVAMGREIDTVVVDNEATAKECIAYLKEQRLSPLTFLPLTTAHAKPINERLRSLPGTAKLAVDLIQFEPAMQRAFEWALGNTLICETLEEARKLAFGAERHKVVSADGSLINKAGLMTGGGTEGLGNRAARWDETAVAEAKAKRAKLEAQLKALLPLRQIQDQEQQLAADIGLLEGRSRYAAADLTTAKDKIAKLEAEAATAEAAAARYQPELDRLEASVAARAQDIEVFTTRINSITDRIFAEFSKKLKLGSIREYEEGHAEFENRTREERLRLASKSARIQSQIEYERGRDLAARLTKREEDLARDKKRLEDLQAELEEEQAGLQAVDVDVDKLVAAVADAKKQNDLMEAAVRDLRKEANRLSSEVLALRARVVAAETAEEQLAARVKDMLDVATVEQIVLPRKEGAETPDPDAMDVDDDPTNGPGSPTHPGAAVATVALAAATLASLDFSSLGAKQLAVKEREAAEADFRAKIDELQGALERAAPNLKAVEQFKAVKEREVQQEAALAKARAHTKAIAEQFNAVRQQRHDRFTAAFDHIAKEINDIYKQLTRSSVHPLGGTAYLSLDSSSNDEPFLGGIKYNAMPPTKRFRDMEQLSGGEKTMAGIALMFAIHSYRPSPFFVLDEVDAALDSTNVARVAHYIRDKTRTNSNKGFQSIVISLKDNFYEKADALVGVARDIDQACSKTFSFDLESFAAPAPAEA